MSYYIGELIQVIFDQVPDTNFLLCDGSTLSISSYPELYSVIRTTYGGNGVTTFNLPDYRPINPKTGLKVDLPNGAFFRGQQYFKFYICASGGTIPDFV